ncbi:MAG: Phenylacetic acid catabolic protein, partial [Mycetocola sp.]
SSGLREAFDRVLTDLFAEAELARPRTPIASGGGRRGQHSEYLGYLLTEMQVLARRHPGATW